MGLLDSIQDGISGITDSTKEFISTPTGAAIGGAVLGSAVTGATIATVAGLSSKSRKKRRKTKKKSRSYRRRKKKRKNSRYARTAGKRKDSSHRRIRQTKNGQPYIILASGKARFISRASARRSRRRRGGRY